MLSIKKVLAEAKRQHETLNENCNILNFDFELRLWVYKLNSDVTRFGKLCWKMQALIHNDPVFQVQ